MNSFYVYILKCNDGSYYTGHTNDLEKRFAEHQNKSLLCYTSSRLPVRLVFIQEFSSRKEAFFLERQIKGWSRNKKEALISNNFDLLVRYSKSRK
jgi:predicted GIY-YIG superfamily endonuclease